MFILPIIFHAHLKRWKMTQKLNLPGDQRVLDQKTRDAVYLVQNQLIAGAPKSDLIFTIKKWQNSRSKVTFITEPKKVLFIKVVLFLRFEHESSIKNSRKSFKLLKFKLKVKVINKPSILVFIWLLCHIFVLFIESCIF